MKSTIPPFYAVHLVGADSTERFATFKTQHDARMYAQSVRRIAWVHHVELLEVDGTISDWAVCNHIGTAWVRPLTIHKLTVPIR